MLHDANGEFQRVKVANGNDQVEVILRNSCRNTGFSFGLFGFSWNIRATNYAERLVDAVPRRGSINGAPWNRQPVSTGSLKAKCEEIEKEEAAKPENWDWSQIDNSLNAQEAYFNSPQWLYALSKLQGYNSEIDYDWYYDDCSACRSEPEP